jgi:SAM-dependent methyltransferase
VQASVSAVRDTGPAADYARFHAAVARAQLNAWLPSGQARIVDISGPGSTAAEAAACAGHTVLRVIGPGTRPPLAQAPPPPAAGGGGARLRAVAADGWGLEFLADGCVDGVIAEDRALSRHLAAEPLVAEIARVLRPGGQVLACVDSLTFGMAVLAEQHRWPHLVDVPNCDVVLVPLPDDSITRCYGAEQLRELFTSGGLEVDWIRPRTVFSPRTVSYLLARDPGSFRALVEAELRARSDDSVGAQLITCARKKPLPAATVEFRLARHASRGGGARLEPRFRDLEPAVHAPPVAAVVDSCERREDRRPVLERRLHRRLIAVGLGQVGASVARLRGPAPGHRVFTPQHQDRAVQVVAHFLKTLAGDANFHRKSSLPPRVRCAVTAQGRAGSAPRTQDRGGRSP